MCTLYMEHVNYRFYYASIKIGHLFAVRAERRFNTAVRQMPSGLCLFSGTQQILVFDNVFDLKQFCLVENKIMFSLLEGDQCSLLEKSVKSLQSSLMHRVKLGSHESICIYCTVNKLLFRYIDEIMCYM